MKNTKKFLAVAVITAAVATYSAYNVSAHRGGDNGNRSGYTNFISAITNLSTAEINDLLNQEAEERGAKDIYSQLAEKYPDTPLPFPKIKNAESKHQSILSKIIEENSLTALSDYGNFQSSYDSLLSKGNTSLKDAIEVGITIEIKDIKDLESAIDNTTNEDLKKVYEKLKKGSLRHLRAFVVTLQKNDFTTSLNWQEYVSQEEVDTAIENTDKFGKCENHEGKKGGKRGFKRGGLKNHNQANQQ